MKNKAEETVSEGLVDVAEAQKFLGGISRSKLYQMMEAGELPHVKIGRCRRIPRSALRELAAKALVG